VQFHFNDGIYRAVRITGPTHNLLGLAFLTPQEKGGDVVSVEPLTRANEPARLHAEDVREKVLEGVREANAHLQANYRPSRIQFVLSDSGPVEIYRMLARRIVERLHHHPDSYSGTAD